MGLRGCAAGGRAWIDRFARAAPCAIPLWHGDVGLSRGRKSLVAYCGYGCLREAAAHPSLTANCCVAVAGLALSNFRYGYIPAIGPARLAGSFWPFTDLRPQQRQPSIISNEPNPKIQPEGMNTKPRQCPPPR